jgi:hypothetical protein
VKTLQWYDYLVELATELVDVYADDAHPSLKEVACATSFETACEDIADSTTKIKIDALGVRCGVCLTGTKKNKIMALARWKAGL